MIQKALQFTSTVLDQFLKNRFGLDDDKTLINTVIEGDGSVPIINQNRVVISLINLQRETLKPFYVRNQRLSNGGFAQMTPSERYNLDLLVTSNFDDYSETLKFLDAIIFFFQTNPAIDSSIYSTLPYGIQKLEFELESLDYHRMHNLWNAMGAKYRPSVIYRTRLVNMLSDQVNGFNTAVEQTSNTVEV